MTSSIPLGTIGRVPSLLAATIYQGIHDRKRKICNTISTEIYTPNTGVGGLLIQITSTACGTGTAYHYGYHDYTSGF